MAKHDWIIEVFMDLEHFAAENGLIHLVPQIERAREIAITEIQNLQASNGQPSCKEPEL